MRWSPLLKKFELDYNIFEAMKLLSHPDRVCREYVTRDRFQTPTVDHLRLACMELHFLPHLEFKEVVTKRALCVKTSNGVEQLNNHQSNSHQVRNWGGRFRRPQTSLAVTVREGVLQNVHSYKEVDASAPLPPHAVHLDQTAFVPALPPSLPFNTVKGTHAKSPYFSPSAENVGLPVADNVVKRHMHSKGDFGQMW